MVVKGLLDALVANEVVAPVSEPSEWVSPLVVIINKKGKLRLCVDQTRLNCFVLQPKHLTRTSSDAMAGIDSESRFFTSFDATYRYFQIPLHPSSQHLTTFMTPCDDSNFLRHQWASAAPGMSAIGPRKQLSWHSPTRFA